MHRGLKLCAHSLEEHAQAKDGPARRKLTSIRTRLTPLRERKSGNDDQDLASRSLSSAELPAKPCQPVQPVQCLKRSPGLKKNSVKNIVSNITSPP